MGELPAAWRKSWRLRAMGVRVVLVRRPREQTDGVDSIPVLVEEVRKMLEEEGK